MGAHLIEVMSDVLAKIPVEWRGTTFKNSALLGREVFSQRLLTLVNDKGAALSTEDLEAVGNAEDYLRVATNIATTLETALALQHGVDVSQVFTFASEVMPIVAVALTVGARTTKLFVGKGVDSPLNARILDTLAQLGGKIEVLKEDVPASRTDDSCVHIAMRGAGGLSSGADAIIAPNLLIITDIGRQVINHADILVIRKRMATPVTTPVAEAMLQELAAVPVTANQKAASDDEVAAFYAHLQELSGTAVDTDNNPVVFTAGLSAIASLWLTLLADGGADICMASTAYGGSSQLTDVVSSRARGIVKHTYDIQGQAGITKSIKDLLDKLAAKPEDLRPTTVLFSEIPTNPDMKVPEMNAISSMLTAYQAATGKRVILLVDGTFAPSSKVMKKMRELNKDLPVMVFLSMSKSVSRGITTAGTVIANHTEVSKRILNGVRVTAEALDTNAKGDQMLALCENHRGVEERCRKAYEVAVATGNRLVEQVKLVCGYDMPLAFVSPENAAKGFTTSTYSFNLPPPKNATAETNAALAQRFVDLLTERKEFKPCVSFGQDNGLVYCTVPATSTQGAIKEEDKAKQAVGGVQLVRLSFPPTIDTQAVCDHIANCVTALYTAAA